MLERLLAESESQGAAAGADFLLDTLPGEKVAELLTLDGIPPQAKVDVLVRYVAARAELPPGCDFLWHRGTKATDQAATEETLTTRVSLPGQVLGTLFYLSPEQAIGTTEQIAVHLA